MEYKFTSKFNIGDTVYTYEPLDDYYCCIKEAYSVERIRYEIYADHTTVIYSLKPQEQGNFKWNCYIAEDWLFATYEECKVWCERHNKETKTW